MTKKSITLIAGPTASGKSNYALNLAKDSNAIIINTDSMQVYDVLQIITARPSLLEMENVPHFLYGHVSPTINYSTGKWLKDVAKILKDFPNQPLIFVGGTGLYFRALLEGLAEIPTVSDDIRSFWRNKLDEDGIDSLYNKLFQIDPISAKKINNQDSQRILRAIEVFEATGKTLSLWQNNKTKPLLNASNVDKYIIMPERDSVYQRINRRFDKMVEEGALDEVIALKNMQLNPLLPAMKAIGVPEFLDVLSGSLTQNEAIYLAKMQTRRYAKRQMTWFRHQFKDDWNTIIL